jgi:ribosomal protein S18 acetylase RimI-like enzyme
VRAEEVNPASGAPSPASHGPTDVVVSEVAHTTDVTPELVEAFAALIPQLSSSSPPPGRAELEAMVASPASILLVARDRSERIIGSLTLAVFRVPTGLRAWIEDVVVDGSSRGAGTGAALVTHAVDRARSAGARSVDLTSRPSRESANRLYQRLGFEQRTTNVYRISL